MKASQLNEYLQTLATLGAIVGLLLVGYEIRQSNNLALAEAASANWNNSMNRQLSLLDAGIPATLAKAMTAKSSELTLEEKLALDYYLQTWMLEWSRKLAVFWLLDIDRDEAVSEIEDLIAEVAPYVFSSVYARAWWEVYRDRAAPDFARAVDRGLKNAPVGLNREKFERIDEVAEAMEGR